MVDAWVALRGAVEGRGGGGRQGVRGWEGRFNAELAWPEAASAAGSSEAMQPIDKARRQVACAGCGRAGGHREAQEAGAGNALAYIPQSHSVGGAFGLAASGTARGGQSAGGRLGSSACPHQARRCEGQTACQPPANRQPRCQHPSPSAGTPLTQLAPGGEGHWGVGESGRRESRGHRWDRCQGR